MRAAHVPVAIGVTDDRIGTGEQSRAPGGAGRRRLRQGGANRMRVLFSTWAWPSHFFPMVPLAWAFRAAGHEVRVASQPALTDHVVRAGLAAVPVGTDPGDDIVFRHDRPEETLLDPATSEPGHVWSEYELTRWRIMKTIFSAMAERMVDDLVGLTREWRPDLIVGDPTTFATSVAAAVTDTPDVRLLYGPDVTGSRGPELDAALRPPAFTSLFERFGVAPRDGLARWTVDPTPPRMQSPTVVDRIPLRHVPFSGGGTVPDWLRVPPERPRVCVSWGTMQRQLSSSERTPEVLEALCGLDVDVVLLGADPELRLPDRLEGRARAVRFLPVDLLLPSCAAILHQAGPGTALAAAHHAVPQLVFPHVADQAITAERLSRTGVARIARPDASAEEICEHVGDLLHGGALRRSADDLAAELAAMPAPAEVVAELEGRVSAASGGAAPMAAAPARPTVAGS